MSQAVAQIQAIDWTPEQLALIKNTIARGATDNELQLFLYRCKNMGLDPLKPGQIYFIKYGNSPGTIVVGIEGFRAKASKTGKLNGIKRGAIRDEKGQCIGAWAEVYRKDWDHPAREEVPLDEYNTGKGNWAKMPETMIKKVAEAATLRMAFPDDLGGVYTNEEMDQAAAESARVAPIQPEETDGFKDPHYEFTHIQVGKFAGKRWEEIPIEELRKHLVAVETRMEKAIAAGKPIDKEAEFRKYIEIGGEFVANFENQRDADEDFK